jgi:voltage-gated potassium channel Kch
VPEYAPKYAPLDRLEELRLVLGYEDSHIPWREIEKRFTVRPKATGSSGSTLFSERLNVNVASRDDIVEFLLAHQIETTLEDGSLESTRKEINKYASNAQEIAVALVPDGLTRPTYTDGTIQSTLQGVGVNQRIAPQLFSAISQYYRVNITTEVNNIQSHLSALVHVDRKPDRTGKSADVQQFDLN